MLALVAILSMSCLITVPLLHWSSPLQKLGARTIIIYWGFLVILGFLAIIAEVLYWAPDSNGPTAPWLNYSNVNDVACAFPMSQINHNASKIDSDSNSSILNITSDWSRENECLDPCKQMPLTYPIVLFREPSDLQLLSQQASQHIQVIATTNNSFFDVYQYNGGITAIVILSQGISTAFFNRRKPRQSRNRFYLALNHFPEPFRSLREVKVRLLGKAEDVSVTKTYHTFHSNSEPGNATEEQPVQNLIAKYFAVFAHLLAIFASLLSMLLFIFNIVAVEHLLGEFPLAKSSLHIGAWSPCAGTALVLLAALITKIHDIHPVNATKIYLKLGNVEGAAVISEFWQTREDLIPRLRTALDESGKGVCKIFMGKIQSHNTREKLFKKLVQLLGSFFR